MVVGMEGTGWGGGEWGVCVGGGGGGAVHSVCSCSDRAGMLPGMY